MEENKPFVCSFCNENFVSKTKLFKHLAIHGVEINGYKPAKIVLLVGWLSQVFEDNDVWINELPEEATKLDKTSWEVESSIFKALYALENNLQTTDGITITERPKGYSRGSGYQQRTSNLFATEPTCHGQCDTFCLQIKPIAQNSVETWRTKMNSFLPETIRVLECYLLDPSISSTFHAESDCSQRRYEYLVPLRFIMPDDIVKAPSVPVTRKSRHRIDLTSYVEQGLMDERFPIDTEDGQKRVAFFRKLKSIFKAVAGKKKYHNFVTVGAAPSDSTVSRRLDRIYHKEILDIDGETWVVFSISGDSLLRGEARKLLGLTLSIALGFMPEEYLQVATIGDDSVLEIPSLPGWALYLAECRYCYWEAKFTDYRLDPRRLENTDTSRIDEWTHILHKHIAKISTIHGNHWIDSFKGKCNEIFTRYQIIINLKNRDLKQIFAESFEADLISSDEIKEDIDNESINEPVSPSQVVSQSSRSNNQKFLEKSLHLSFYQIPSNKEDVPEIYREVLHMLRAADRSMLWPASSTGRSQVIMAGTLLESGGRGGSFSVGALPKHFVQPKGNDIFPGILYHFFKYNQYFTNKQFLRIDESLL